MQGPVGGLSLVRVVVEHRDKEICECLGLGVDEMVPMENVREGLERRKYFWTRTFSNDQQWS